VLLLVSGVLWATGWAASIIAWAGDLILDNINEIVNTQHE